MVVGKGEIMVICHTCGYPIMPCGCPCSIADAYRFERRNIMERPKPRPGKILVEGVGYFDGDDVVGLKKAYFKQKVMWWMFSLCTLCIVGIGIIWICLWSK